MVKLSVNINKFATLRNSRGGNTPDVLKAAIDAERFGADGCLKYNGCISTPAVAKGRELVDVH
ncbi:MAG TPA: pyridoxine 5'-phosphate synthase [Flavitalea sp.]|nr:pyridoxine 5'-phosphate synthase [Flavitalea sp.]